MDKGGIGCKVKNVFDCFSGGDREIEREEKYEGDNEKMDDLLLREWWENCLSKEILDL